MQCKQLWCEIYNEFIEGAKPLSYQESHDSLFGQFFIIKDLKGNIVINNKALIEIYPKKCSYVDIHEVTVNGIPCKFSKGYWLYESDTIRNLWENELFFEIKYRSTDGILKVLTDIHYLSVFRPRIIVSTTSDKTLLIGLMNNVNVFVSGCNPEDIQVAFEGATGVRKEVLGEYYVEVGSQSRNVIVKVFFKGGCIGTDTLKVIPVSNMSCLLNNHWGSLISKENLVIVDSLKLYWPIDIANNKYWSTIDIDISTYSCTIIGKNKESTFHVKGNKFTKQMVGKFKKCSQNDIIVFNQIIGKRTYKGLLTDKIYPLVLTIK